MTNILAECRREANEAAHTYEIDWDVIGEFLPHLEVEYQTITDHIATLETMWHTTSGDVQYGVEQTLYSAYITQYLYERIRVVEGATT